MLKYEGWREANVPGPVEFDSGIADSTMKVEVSVKMLFRIVFSTYLYQTCEDPYVF
jgi:hypothetical protein